MIEALLAPWQFAFMQKALVVALLLAVPTALLSTVLVLKGWSLMGDAISHAVLPGIVLAWAVGLPLSLGALLAALLCTNASAYISDRTRLKPDTVMGVVFSGLFGLGLVLYMAIKPDEHLDHILFGDLLGVSDDEMHATVLTSIIVSGLLLSRWRDIKLFSFDPVQARVIGLSVAWLHYGLLTLLAVTIVNSLSVAGILLAVGLLVLPGATAYLLTTSFALILCYSVAINIVGLSFGIFLSFAWDSAPAPTVIVVLSGVFAVTLLTRRCLAHYRQNRRPASQDSARPAHTLHKP